MSMEDLEDEMEKKRLLEMSVGELEATVQEVERRLDSIDDEANEWKVRQECQRNLNSLFERQILNLQDKADYLRKELRLGGVPKPTSGESGEAIIERQEKERQRLESSLADLQWRLEKEQKTYIKANEERKQYTLEINSTTAAIEDLKTRARGAHLGKALGHTAPRT